MRKLPSLPSFKKAPKAALAPIILTPSLCGALGVVSQIFGQTWHFHVVGELAKLTRQDPPIEGDKFVNYFLTLLREATKNYPGLERRFVVMRNQIRYRTPDRRYTVVILQGPDHDLLLTWQVSTREGGTSSITYQVHGDQWRCTSWQVAEQCQEDLPLLVKTGGEVLGFLAERKLIPPGSLFQTALDRQIADTVNRRDSARPRPSGPPPTTE